MTHRVSGGLLLSVVGTVLAGLGILVWRTAVVEERISAAVRSENAMSDPAIRVRALDGRVYRCPADPHPAVTRVLAAGAGAVTGLVGIGIGEATSSRLVLRLRWRARVAIGTGVPFVLPTVITAGVVQATLLPRAGLAVPWNIVVWTVPAVLLGGQLGPRLTGILPEPRLKRAVGGLFIVIATIAVALSVR